MSDEKTQTPDEQFAALKARLTEAMDKEPGLMRRLLGEFLDREDVEEAKARASEPNLPMPENAPPPKRQFKARTEVVEIVLDSPNMGAELLSQLANLEADAIIFRDGAWVYIRQRAFAEEVKESDDTTSGSVEPGTREGETKPAGQEIPADSRNPNRDDNDPED